MHDDRRALAALLLVLQAGLALLAAVGLFTYARLSHAVATLAVPEALAFGGPVVLVLLGVGILAGWRAARLGVYVWEMLTLLGTGFSILASGGSSLSLTVGLTGLALPAAIVFLVRSPKSSGYDLQRGLTFGLLLLTGVIHLALVPDHLGQPPRLGGLFAIDGVAFVALALASLRLKWWRAPTLALLLASILAYLVVVISRREAVDDLGIATKLIELAALGLVVWPRLVRVDRRWAFAVASVLVSVVASGSIAWAATLRPGPVGHAHDSKVVLTAAEPTDNQRAGAAQLVEDTRAGIEKYADVQVAVADGYRPTTPTQAPTVHYANPTYQRDGRTLDPSRPEALVYANTRRGPMLIGAMYMTAGANVRPPDVGGSLAEWHTHPNLCFTLPAFTIDGFESPFGTCPVGSINGPTPAMLHVWTVANSAGPFGELSPAFVERLTQ